MIGLPDCGSICKAKHVPDYVTRIQDLKDAGFGNVLISSVTSPEKLQAFMDDTGASKVGIKALADSSGAFTRMLGLEINEPGTSAPYSHRFTCFVQDGILVRLVCTRSSGKAALCLHVPGICSHLHQLCRNLAPVDFARNGRERDLYVRRARIR